MASGGKRESDIMSILGRGLGEKKKKNVAIKKNIRIFAVSFYKEYVIMYVRQRPCTWARREHWQEVTNKYFFKI